jgi:hypothetical protein
MLPVGNARNGLFFAIGVGRDAKLYAVTVIFSGPWFGTSLHP